MLPAGELVRSETWMLGAGNCRRLNHYVESARGRAAHILLTVMIMIQGTAGKGDHVLPAAGQQAALWREDLAEF